MSSSHLASTVCPHVGGKADLCSATPAADFADQITRWSCVFRAGVCHKSLVTSALLTGLTASKLSGIREMEMSPPLSAYAWEQHNTLCRQI